LVGIVRKRHQKLLSEWEEYIQKKVNCTVEIRRDDKEDAKQYLRLELIKASRNRCKYNDWWQVCKGVIDRRVTDFLNKGRRDRKRHLFENQLLQPFDDAEDDDIDYTRLAEIDEEEPKDVYVVASIREFFSKVVNGFYKYSFTDWEKECFEILLELHDNGQPYDVDDIMACMGEDERDQAQRMRFFSRYRSFQIKMNKYAEEIGV
jgi:hypothetical protein